MGMAGSRGRVADVIAEQLTNFGISVLRNQVGLFGGLYIAGIDDFWGTNYGAQTVTAEIASQEPAIVLCHNPDVVDEPVWQGYKGWILSGHTHGGQCKPPFLPPPILPVRNTRYTSGAFDLADGRFLYINRALGYIFACAFWGAARGNTV